MKNLPIISVVITAYNVEKYIGRCLRSAINQTFSRQNYEIIVVDDSSKDRTKYGLELFKDEVRIIQHSERLGVAASVNTGIRASRGQFVVRIDADDYVHTEYLNILSLYLQMNSDFDAVACDYLLVDDQEIVLERVNCMERPIACGIMFRIEKLIDIGLYDDKFFSREEEDLRHRFLQRYSLTQVQLPLYRYRRHGQNMTDDQKTMEKYHTLLKQKHGLSESS